MPPLERAALRVAVGELTVWATEAPVAARPGNALLAGNPQLRAYTRSRSSAD